jgi:DNA-binding LacI/PurR family transcriptional regulator
VKATKSLLAREPQITAIFAENDTLAASVLAVAQHCGIAVPGLLSVVGYDDSPIAEQVWPGLTAIRQDDQAIAEHAVEILEQGVRAWKADRSLRLSKDVLFPYQMVTPASVANFPETALVSRSRR